MISPEFSAVAVGAYALTLSIVVAATFSLLALLDLPRMRCVAVYASAVVGIVAGLATMGYTGVLLQSMASVLFWQTPLLTTLFMLSSASCGIAVAFLAASFVEARHPFVSPIAWLARIDSALIVLEALCLAAYLVGAASNQGTLLAAEALVAGEEAWLFWGGLVVCGLAVPLALERFVTHGNYRTQLLWIAALLLAGGFVLRWCIAGAADYDVTQMPNALFGYTMMN